MRGVRWRRRTCRNRDLRPRPRPPITTILLECVIHTQRSHERRPVGRSQQKSQSIGQKGGPRSTRQPSVRAGEGRRDGGVFGYRIRMNLSLPRMKSATVREARARERARTVGDGDGRSAGQGVRERKGEKTGGKGRKRRTASERFLLRRPHLRQPFLSGVDADADVAGRGVLRGGLKGATRWRWRRRRRRRRRARGRVR